MSFFYKQIDSITPEDIQSLKEDKVSEKRTVEYKSTLPKTKENSRQLQDGEKKEFLLDVCSFANSEGGDIFYGITEESGIITEINGITVEDEDALQLQLSEIILKGIRPQIRFDFKFVPMSDDERVLILRVYKSWNPPHAVWDEYAKFCARSTNGRYWMDLEAIRNTFIGSETLRDKAHSFRFKRIDQLIAGNSDVSIRGLGENIYDSQGVRYCIAILHILPLSSFSTVLNFDIKSILNNEELDSKVIGAKYYQDIEIRHHKITVDGVCFTHWFDSEHPSYEYIKLFHDFTVEVALSVFAERIRNETDYRIGKFSVDMNKLFERALLLIRDICKIQPPYITAFSLLHCKGITFILNNWDRRELDRIDRDYILLPEQLLMDYPSDPVEHLIPYYNKLWNSVGEIGAPLDWVREVK